MAPLVVDHLQLTGAWDALFDPIENQSKYVYLIDDEEDDVLFDDDEATLSDDDLDEFELFERRLHADEVVEQAVEARVALFFDDLDDIESCSNMEKDLDTTTTEDDTTRLELDHPAIFLTKTLIILLLVVTMLLVS